jgi:hypothetical protein
MLRCLAVPLRVFSWRSLQIQSNQSVCGPSVLRRPAGLTSKAQLTIELAQSFSVHSGAGAPHGSVELRFGLSVLRRPAHQPGHIVRLRNSRMSVGVCSAWLAKHIQKNGQMHYTSAHLHRQCLRSGAAMRVHGSSARHACVRQRPWPNPSVEATNCSKLQFAPHLER